MSSSTRYDIVIVGSGLGGLICAGILSKQGKKVCVLEKHNRIGGNLQTFKREGCLFDTGVHYIGCMDPGQILHQVYKYLGVLDQMTLDRLDEDGYDVISIGEKEYKLANGYDNYAASLKTYFPEEGEAIDQFVDTLRNIWDNVGLLNFNGRLNEELPGVWKYNQNAHDFIAGLTDNEELRAVLAGNNGLYTGNSQKTPLYMMANINSFFIKSAWRLAGGGSQLAEALGEQVEKAGGKVIVKANVVKLKAEDKRIEAAVLDNGEEIYGDTFISNIHPSLTMDLLDPGVLRRVYVDRIKSLENGISVFTLYLTLEKGKVPHRNSNLYYSKDTKVWDLHKDPEQEWPHGYMLYTTEDDHSGFAESMTIITMMRFDEVEQWSNTTVEKRGEAYNQFKKERSEALLALVSQKYPELKEAVKSSFVSTPLTFRDYTGTVRGSMYGIEKDSHDPVRTSILPNTKVKNLFLTGQNINIHGTLGVTMGSLLTCAYMVDLEALMNEIKNA